MHNSYMFKKKAVINVAIIHVRVDVSKNVDKLNNLSFQQQCPGNVHMENGSPCQQDTQSCNEGICLTHDLQCRILWGEGKFEIIFVIRNKLYLF